MKIRHARWKIKTLNSKKDKINPKPQYQRTSVWSPAKKKLLIDSILRGYDIPKFYLRETPNDPHYDYEVTDGQQRMRAIWEFMSNDKKEAYKLDAAIIKKINTEKLSYNELGSLKDNFDDYEINIALIEDSTPEEIRSLFARLQMGTTLNKVELRHAMASNIGAAIISIVETHKFFNDCKISNSRYKHQDYMDHVMTLSYRNGYTDVKALDIEKMYKELSNADQKVLKPYLSKALIILDWMNDINNLSKGIFRNKWAFVDTFWLLHEIYSEVESINYSKFVEQFLIFEKNRKDHNKNPEKLIEDKTSSKYDKDLYDYIMAFKYSGNEEANILKRHEVFIKKFKTKTIFKMK